MMIHVTKSLRYETKCCAMMIRVTRSLRCVRKCRVRKIPHYAMKYLSTSCLLRVTMMCHELILHYAMPNRD